MDRDGAAPCKINMILTIFQSKAYESMLLLVVTHGSHYTELIMFQDLIAAILFQDHTGAFL